MKSKICSIIVALSWFALVGVWYVFSALHFYHYKSILDPLRQIDVIVGLIWLIVPPFLWWIPRRLLIRKKKWHRIGTIVFCIVSISCSLLLFLLIILFGNNPAFNKTIFGSVTNSLITFFIWIDTGSMLFMEFVFLGFREPLQKQNSGENGS